MSEDKTAQLIIIPIIGGPGSGKGTQCTKLAKELSLVHLSTGDILREEASDNTNDELSKKLSSGHLISSELLIEIIEKRLKNYQKSNSKVVILLDGFPRNQDNIYEWEKRHNPAITIPFYLYFECPDNLMLERILKFKGTLRGNTIRNDDDEETAKKRIEIFHKETLPLLPIIQSTSLLYTIDLKKSIEVVHKELSEILKKNNLIA